MSNLIHFERHGPIGILRLQRPEVHNAINRALLGQFEVCLESLDGQPDIAVLILTGAGTKSFCAGSDLSEFAEAEERHCSLELVQRMEAVLERLEAGPQVSIAALNGSAFGGGSELLTACHLRVAADSARFSFRQASLGVTTGWGGGRRLFRLVGRAAALRLLLTADTIDAKEAHRLGLVDFLVPVDQVLREALSLAERIAANGHEALRGFLELAQAIDHLPGDRIPTLERELFERCSGGERFWRRAAEWRERRHRSRRSSDQK